MSNIESFSREKKKKSSGLEMTADWKAANRKFLESLGSFSRKRRDIVSSF